MNNIFSYKTIKFVLLNKNKIYITIILKLSQKNLNNNIYPLSNDFSFIFFKTFFANI